MTEEFQGHNTFCQQVNAPHKPVINTDQSNCACLFVGGGLVPKLKRANIGVQLSTRSKTNHHVERDAEISPDFQKQFIGRAPQAKRCEGKAYRLELQHNEREDMRYFKAKPQLQLLLARLWEVFF